MALHVPVGHWNVVDWQLELSHFSWNAKRTIHARWLANWNQDLSQFAHDFQSSYMHILFNIKVKILMLIKWSYWSLQLCWLLNLDWSPYSGHVVQSLYVFLVSILGATCHSNVSVWLIKISNQIKHIYLKCLLVHHLELTFKSPFMNFKDFWDFDWHIYQPISKSRCVDV